MRGFGFALLALMALAAIPAAEGQDKKKEAALAKDSFYALKTKTLEGKDVELKDYAGKVALVVNLASQ